jgi:hypothetical protein
MAPDIQKFLIQGSSLLAYAGKLKIKIRFTFTETMSCILLSVDFSEINALPKLLRDVMMKHYENISHNTIVCIATN